MTLAARLRERVRIERPDETQVSATGTRVPTWTTVADRIPAEVTPLRGREYIDIRAAASEITTRIRLRYRPGMNPAMRIVHGASIYNIVEVIDVDARHRQLECMCVAAAVDS